MPVLAIVEAMFRSQKRSTHARCTAIRQRLHCERGRRGIPDTGL